MRKVAALLAMLLAFGLSLTVSPALANPHHSDLIFAEPEDDETKEHERQREETDRVHRELDERFEDVSRVIIPPRGLVPAEASELNITILPETPVIKYEELPEITADSQSVGLLGTNQPPTYLVLGPGQEVPSAVTQNANKYAPIQLKDLVRSSDGPANDFMRSALLLLVVLAVVAAVMLGIVSKSALRLKKKARAL